jgi:hypothetical protein
MSFADSNYPVPVSLFGRSATRLGARGDKDSVESGILPLGWRVMIAAHLWRARHHAAPRYDQG